MAAGCREQEWKDDQMEEYFWKPHGELLADEACLSQDSKKHLAPNFGRTKVIGNFLHHKVRNVDSRQQTMSIDMKLSLRWFDPNVKHNQAINQLESRDIFLSPIAVEKIWTPDLVIQDLTALKIRSEWISMISAKVLVPNDLSNLRDQDSTSPNIEVTYQIKSSVYCSFDHSKYPMDKQECNVTIGSNSYGAIFVLDDTDENNENAMIYSTSNFDISSTIFDNNRHDSGNNTIGISVVLTHGVEPYLFKYYIPSIAIVTISMMGFTMPLTALPERVALLVTQFLTLTELFIHEMGCKLK